MVGPPATGDAPPTGSSPLLGRLEDVIARIEQLPVGVRDEVGDLVGAVLAMYGDGLARIVRAVDEAGDGADGVRRLLVEDEAVASLLLIHDLYPVPLEERVRRGLERARPYVESHGGNIELIALEAGVAHVRLGGTCDGCPASATTLDLLVRRALEAEAPDLAGLEVEGADASEPDTRAPEAGAGPPRFVGIEAPATPPLGALASLELRNRRLLLAHLEGGLLAYEDGCAACGKPLEDAGLDGEILTCRGCGMRFDLRRAGRALADGGAPLHPVPLLHDESRGLGLVLER